MKKSTRTLLLWVGAFVGPLVICTINVLCLPLLPGEVSDVAGPVAYYGSLALGVCCLMMLPYQRWVRVVTAVLYLPVMAGFLFLIMLIIDCSLHDTCL